MPEAKTMERARRAQRQGKSPSTAAGEFVREEMEHIRQGKHGARSTKQAIAIGLSKARRSGVRLAAPKRGRTSSRTRQQAERDLQKGRSAKSSGRKRSVSPRRSRASTNALKREGRGAASRCALSSQARRSSRQRSRRGAVGQRRPAASKNTRSSRTRASSTGSRKRTGGSTRRSRSQ